MSHEKTTNTAAAKNAVISVATNTRFTGSNNDIRQCSCSRSVSRGVGWWHDEVTVTFGPCVGLENTLAGGWSRIIQIPPQAGSVHCVRSNAEQSTPATGRSLEWIAFNSKLLLLAGHFEVVWRSFYPRLCRKVWARSLRWWWNLLTQIIRMFPSEEVLPLWRDSP